MKLNKSNMDTMNWQSEMNEMTKIDQKTCIMNEL